MQGDVGADEDGSMTRSQETSAPPSIALALMAGALAHRRRHPYYKPHVALGWASAPRISRAKAAEDPRYYDVTTEYYAILDRLTRGEVP